MLFASVNRLGISCSATVNDLILATKVASPASDVNYSTANGLIACHAGDEISRFTCSSLAARVASVASDVKCSTTDGVIACHTGEIPRPQFSDP